MSGDGGGGESRFEQWGARLGAILVLPTLLILFAGGVYAILDAVLAPTPVAENPGFVDTVLASRAVVAAIRLAIIFAGTFIVVSVVALIARGQWLTRVGPVHVSERVNEEVSGMDAENERLRRSLENARETIDNLKGDLVETNRLLDQKMLGDP